MPIPFPYSAAAGLPLVTVGNGTGVAVGVWPESPTLFIPHTYALMQTLAASSSGAGTGIVPNWYIPVPPGQTCSLVGVIGNTYSGSCTVDIQHSSAGGALAAITGMTSLNFTSGVSTTLYQPTSWTDVLNNDAFSIYIDTITGSPTNLTVTFYFAYVTDSP